MIVRVLFDGLWEGAAIVAIAYLVNCCVPQRNATTRYAVWFATLLALVAVPVLTVLSNAGALLLTALQPHAVAGEHAWRISLLPAQPLVRGAAGFFTPALRWIPALWLLGAGVCFARLGASLARIAHIRKRAIPSQTAADVLVSADVAIPIAVGFRNPAIIIPKTLFETLAPADLDRVIAHERAHLRRHDVPGNLVQRLVEAILFFNPWVHFAGRNLTLERESACDDWAVRKTGDPGEYAAFLATLARRVCQTRAPLATPSALGSRHELVERIERLAGAAPRALTVNYYVIGGTVMIFVLLTLALEAFSPALALAPPAPVSAPAGSGSAVVAACAKPNVDALVTGPAEPQMPRGLKTGGSAIIAVTIAPNGTVTGLSLRKSSGNAAIDRSVAEAALHSKYSPKLVNCVAVAGTYLFRADFAPGAH
ncbi:MAG: M56 family metallopeptidase [Candidatus Cybelea sp.]